MRESEILHDIRLALGAVPGLALWRINAGALQDETGRTVRMAPEGFSDLIGCYNGRFVALEVKADGGKLREKQKLFLALVRRLGGFGTVVRSVDDALAAIDRASKGLTE